MKNNIEKIKQKYPYKEYQKSGEKFKQHINLDDVGWLIQRVEKLQKKVRKLLYEKELLRGDGLGD